MDLENSDPPSPCTKTADRNCQIFTLVKSQKQIHYNTFNLFIVIFFPQIQEWLCLNCQTQRAISGQLGDIHKMPPAPSGPKASPMPVPTESSSQKTAVPPQVKLVKKQEQEVKTEAEKVILEKVKETLSMEKIPPMVTTDQKQEESKLEKDKASALQEKKPLPEEKKLISEEEKIRSEEKKPLLEEKKPTPEDKKLLPEAKTSAPEEQKHDLLKSQVQIAEEKLEGRVAPKTVQEGKQPQTKMEGLPSGTPQSLPKEDDKTTKTIKEQPQPPCTAKPDQVEPGKEKTVS